MIAGLFFRIGLALLPQELKDRYESEWSAEKRVLAQRGDRAAEMAFATSLPSAAIRITIASRRNGASAYAEMSIAALFGLPPVLALLVLGAWLNVWLLVFAQVLNVIGIVLVAHGFWRNDGRLLDSRGPRVGLLLVVVGGSLGTGLVQGLRALEPIRPDEVISAAIPNTIITIGFILLVVANYTGRLRRRIQLLALVVLAPGSAVSVVVAVVNALNSAGTSRVLSLLYGIPIIGLAWASFVIVGRSRVFAEDEPVVEAA